MRPRLLVDNSVIQRLAKPEVRQAWQRLQGRGDIATCLPSLLEAGFSARSAQVHAELMELEQRAKIMLAPTPDLVPVAVAIQTALFASGKGRTVGVSDAQIAATAMCYSRDGDPVVVIHYDAHFDHIGSVIPEFRAEWVVPRGTVD